MFGLISKLNQSQWPWEFVRALSTAAQHVVSAEVAQHVSQYGRGLVKLPNDMVQTLDGYFKEAGLTGKTAKLRSQALTDQLKALTRSTARGGLQQYRVPDTGAAAVAVKPAGIMTEEQLKEEQQMEEELKELAKTFGPEVVEQYRSARERAATLAALPIPRTKGGRLKVRAKAALLQHISTHGFLSLPHEYVRAALDLPPSSTLDDPQRNLAVKQATPSYNATQALAYALSRLPGCYAASLRIFRELSVRLPGFKPRSLLDFGAGPGTASWAAQEIWQDSLSRVSAIEPSFAMRRLGAQLEAARRFAHPHAPMVHWRSELPPQARSQRTRRHQASHDVVVASYVLGEVADPEERSNIVRRLWGLSSDVLVLIEPGTPAGAANIQEARAAILQHEARRAAKLQRRLASALASNEAGATAEDDTANSSDNNLQQKLSGRWSGAHVVAPCPHDGLCPLAAQGSQAWCHFGTRFQRPAFMQAAKALKGTHMNPADHQDERYSYVVIRRGIRPASGWQVEISRSFSARTDHEGVLAISNVEHRNEHSVKSQQQHQEIPDQLNSPPTNSTLSTHPQESQLTDHPALDNPGVSQQIPAGSKRLAAAPQHVLRDHPLLTVDEMRSLAALAVSPATDHGQQHQKQPERSVQHSQSESIETDSHDHGSSRASRFAPGLINNLIALENAGVDWAAGQASPAHLQLQHNTDLQTAPGTSKSAPVDGMLLTESSDVVVAAAQGGAQVVTPEANSTEEHLSAAEVETAASTTSSWARVIRPPRKRGGHVILDLCVAHTLSHDIALQQSGQLERHIVAKSDVKKWMGKAAYKMAQQACWGDLWPTFYHENPKKQVLANHQV